MKILIVSNLYPPHHVGGYELRCSQVAEYLQLNGNEIRVLTSSYRLPTDGTGSEKDIDESVAGVHVERSLHHYGLQRQPSGRPYTLAMARRQLADTRRFARVLEEFRPDIVSWWNLEGITKTILPIPASRGIPDVCFIDDMWMVREYGTRGENESLLWFRFWDGNWGPVPFRGLLQIALARWGRKVQYEGIPTQRFPNRPRHVCFVSEFMRVEHRTAGLFFPSSEVIYGGVSCERFCVQRAIVDFERGRLRFLYVGYIEPHRGLHTIVDALELVPPDLRESIELSVVHSGPPKPGKYVEQIKTKIEQLGLSQMVTFLGNVRHDEMPGVYREHHVLISASTRPEGLPMAMMEALCGGCAVITTGSGGAIEIADIAELPIFPKDHPLALSRLIAKLARDRGLVFEIASRGQKVALREFTFARMAERICDTLQMLCNRKGSEVTTGVDLTI